MQKLPLSLLPYVFPGTSPILWRRRANAGRLGTIHFGRGRMRNRAVERVAVEAIYGPITNDRLAEAVARYQRDRSAARILGDVP